MCRSSKTNHRIRNITILNNSSYCDKYVPFSPKWYIIGNIVGNGTKLKFEFKHLGNRIDVTERIKKDNINDYEE